MKQADIWIVGVGPIGIEYANILDDLGHEYTAIGRNNKSANEFEKKCNVKPVIGGLEKFLLTNPGVPTYAIVATGVEQLTTTSINLISYGIKNIMVEKPAGINFKELESVAQLAKENNANVFVAYNRRFYTSTLKAQEIVELDGGITSFNFEFTEWTDMVSRVFKAPGVKEKWLLANSTHVIDLAFHLGGKPKEISTYSGGEGRVFWHPTSSIFSGAGVTDKGAFFSYQANWNSPGRWGVEFCTPKRRLIFRPMEQLQIQELNNVRVKPVILEDSLDRKFKPGFFMQVQNFLCNKHEELCSIDEQFENYKIYKKIAKYKT